MDQYIDSITETISSKANNLRAQFVEGFSFVAFPSTTGRYVQLAKAALLLRPVSSCRRVASDIPENDYAYESSFHIRL